MSASALARANALELLRIGPLRHDSRATLQPALRQLLREGCVELEYDDRGELVWRLAFSIEREARP